jgi:methylmalonyl-CoA/ethylmalonyl-CoA epimerase
MTAGQGDFALSKVGQIAVNAKDVDRAVAFYRDALKLPFLFQAPGLGFFQCGETWLMLSPPSEPEFDHPSSILYFDVPDIAVAYAALTGRGVAFRDEPHLIHRDPAQSRELWMAFFQDTEGNTHAIRAWRAVG